MAVGDVEQLIQQLDSLSIDTLADENQRARLHDALQRATLRMESPHDTIYRIVYSPNLLIMTEVASNLGIFSTLAANSPSRYDAAQLAAVRGADVELMGRVARWLAGHGMLDEAGDDAFVANTTTHTLSHPGFRGGIHHYVYTTLPPLSVLPDFLQETSHANPSDLTNCPFQKALGTPLSKFAWQADKPELSAAFGRWMAAQHRGTQSWMDGVDFPALIAQHGSNGGDVGEEEVLFVDVGGGIGHQCAALRKRWPGLAERVVLQDAPEVLGNALPAEGVEKVVQDFWLPQGITGARAYYFRYIMHDYPDDKCRVILQHTVAAMSPDSVVLIDDVVLPDRGAHPYSLDKDIVMMVNFGAMERTARQWRALFDSCGLAVVQVATYNPLSGEAVQVLRKKAGGA